MPVLKKFSTAQILHYYHKLILGVGKRVNEPYNVGVLQLAKGNDFFLHHLAINWVVVKAYDLNCYFGLVNFIKH